MSSDITRLELYIYSIDQKDRPTTNIISEKKRIILNKKDKILLIRFEDGKNPYLCFCGITE